MTVFRGDRRLQVTTQRLVRPAITYVIAEVPDATPEQKSLRELWLAGTMTARPRCKEKLYGYYGQSPHRSQAGSSVGIGPR